MNPKGSVGAGRPRHAQQRHLDGGDPRRADLHRRRAGSRARRGHGNFWAIDAAGKSGDITDSAVVWHVGGEEFHRTMSTAAIHDGLLYIADLSGFVYCFDPRPARSTGSTTPSPRSGARRSTPTARSTSATRTATSPCCRPARADGEAAARGQHGRRGLHHAGGQGRRDLRGSRTKLFAIEDGIRSQGRQPKPAAHERRRAAALATPDREARSAGSTHVREMVQWHFDPETGCPFWLEYAAGWTSTPARRSAATTT